MNILAIETTGAYASVAFAKADRGHVQIISRINGQDRFSHLQNLAPQIQQVLDEANLAVGDLDLIAVSKGPGSFTGIRIGVATARALCQALDLPCVGVPSLEALAMRAMPGEIALGTGAAANCRQIEADAQQTSENCRKIAADDSQSPENGRWDLGNTLICPILDAKRSQVYGGGYYIRDGFPVEEVKAGPYTLEEFMEAVKDYDEVLFMGDGVDKYGDEILRVRTGRTAFAPEEIRYQDAWSVALLGCKMQTEGNTVAFDKLQPEYMRMAEAERKLREKQGK
ncbi:MAG: tRNA (adenosine(37)-N6)-threonylcarbamoyltransferase complex dimerization subunit type 1 TsaB [Eubacteriales bacterium]|nr:tRNA (adenosine(37)-N6)-threonylcarbamoyltransferase complex dimerization subunit type 1 TsaB [Eubacteriales bacterium]